MHATSARQVVMTRAEAAEERARRVRARARASRRLKALALVASSVGPGEEWCETWLGGRRGVRFAPAAPASNQLVPARCAAPAQGPWSYLENARTCPRT